MPQQFKPSLPSWKWWAFLTSLAAIVYKLTTEPILAASILCLQPAQPYWRMAFWIWRFDPQKGRATSVGFALVARGLWATAYGSLALAIACLIGDVVWAILRIQWIALPIAFVITVCLAIFIAWGLATLVSIIAFVWSYISKVPLWIGSRWFRKDAEWLFRSPINEVEMMMLPTALGALIMLPSLLFLAVERMAKQNMAHAVMLAAFCLGIVFTAWLFKVQRRLVADTPVGCWGSPERVPL